MNMHEQMDTPSRRLFTQFVKSATRTIREFAAAILIALTATFFFNVFIAQAVSIDQGPSMQPNLYIGYRVLIEKVTYRFRPPERGEVVVVARPGEAAGLIKRVVAVPGQVIEVRDGHVWINGALVEEPVVSFWGGPYYPPTLVPAGSVFILGDNRGSSLDSRMLGPVPLEAIEGRALYIYWPLDQMGPIP
jgi:signal peptidase I